MKEMLPWYAGFTGTVTKSKEEGRCEVMGCIESTSDTTATITELPVKKWTQDYREFLEENLPKGEKKKEGPKLLEEYTEHHTEKSVHFELILSPYGVENAWNLEQAFKLKSSVAYSNMMLFDAEGKIHKYNTAIEILEAFAAVRLNMYEKRKEYMLNKLTRECDVLSAKARFIKMVIEGKIKIKRRKIKDLANDLRKAGFKPLTDLKVEKEDEDKEGEEGEDQENEDGMDVDEDADMEGKDDSETATKKSNAKDIRDFEYLVGMPISTLTAERVEELMKQQEAKKKELDTLKKKTIQKLWLEDLDELDKAMDERDALIEKEAKVEEAQLKKARAKEAGSAGKGTKRGAKRNASNPPEPKKHKA